MAVRWSELPLWDNPDLCYRYTPRGVSAIKPCRDSRGAVSLGDTQLVCRPDVVVTTENGYSFRLKKEGFYRFGVQPETVANRIVFASDLPGLVGSTGTLHIHGWRDNGMCIEDLLAKAGKGTVSVYCGVIRDMAIHVFEEQGVHARRVESLTLESWNPYSDGHALFEYFEPSERRWVLADPDLGVMFRYLGRDCLLAGTPSGGWLNLFDICSLVRAGLNGEWGIVRVGSGPYFDMCCDGVDTRTAFYELEMPVYDRQQMKPWLRRMFQIPCIGSDFSAGNRDQAERSEAQRAQIPGTLEHLTYLEAREFVERYYCLLPVSRVGSVQTPGQEDKT